MPIAYCFVDRCCIFYMHFYVLYVCCWSEFAAVKFVLFRLALPFLFIHYVLFGFCLRIEAFYKYVHVIWLQNGVVCDSSALSVTVNKYIFRGSHFYFASLLSEDLRELLYRPSLLPENWKVKP